MEITITQFLQYLTFLAFISIFAVGINHLLLRFFKNLGVRRKDADATNVIRWAAQTKPAIGGFSFFLIFLLSIGFYLLSPFGSLENVDKAEFALLFSVSLGFFIGLVDDTYDLPPFFKFSGQLACAAIIIWSNLLIPLTGNFYMDAVATTFWVVMVMNAINLLDNMDGITASVSAFIVLAMFVVAVMLGNVSGFYAVVMLGTVGAMVGFLYLNWNPSKMYMGDTGSQFLGALLSFFSIAYIWNFKGEAVTGFSLQQFLLPLVIFMLPIIDTVTVTVRRIARGQSPFLGGRDHTTHHLAYCGLNDSQVALVFVSLSTLSLIVSYMMMLYIGAWTNLLTGLVVGYLVVMFGGMQMAYQYGKNRLKARQAQKEKAQATKVVRLNTPSTSKVRSIGQ